MEHRYLLDTHVWLWLNASPEKLSEDLLDQFQDPMTRLFLSAASSWEIAIKYHLGKLALPERPELYMPGRMKATGVIPLPILPDHTWHAAALDWTHKDPFDRMLVAQAIAEGLMLVTADEKMIQSRDRLVRV